MHLNSAQVREVIYRYILACLCKDFVFMPDDKYIYYFSLCMKEMFLRIYYNLKDDKLTGNISTEFITKFLQNSKKVRIHKGALGYICILNYVARGQPEITYTECKKFLSHLWQQIYKFINNEPCTLNKPILENIVTQLLDRTFTTICRAFTVIVHKLDISDALNLRLVCKKFTFNKFCYLVNITDPSKFIENPFIVKQLSTHKKCLNFLVDKQSHIPIINKYISHIKKLYVYNVEVDNVNLKGIVDLTVRKNIINFHLESDSLSSLKLEGNIHLKSIITPFLHQLDLSNSNVKDITPLKGLSIKYLNLSNCDIADISIISTLSQLTELNLNYTSVKNLKPLNECTALQRIFLKKTLVQDVSPLKKLSIKVLDLTDTLVVDIKYLGGIYQLNLSHTAVRDQDILHLKNVVILNVSHTKVRDMAVFKNLAVKVLDVSENQHLQNVKHLGKMYALNLSGVFDASSDVLESIYNGLSEVYDLNLSDTDVKSVAKFLGCRKLNLSNTFITSVYPLRSSKIIHTLNLRETALSDISDLATCDNLYNLDISYTRVVDVTKLSNAKSLKILNLEGCNVTDVSNLGKLYHLNINNTLVEKVSIKIPVLEWSYSENLPQDISSIEIKPINFVQGKHKYLHEEVAHTYYDTNYSKRKNFDMKEVLAKRAQQGFDKSRQLEEKISRKI